MPQEIRQRSHESRHVSPRGRIQHVVNVPHFFARHDAELDGLRIHDINNVQGMMLFNIGDAEMTVGELMQARQNDVLVLDRSVDAAVDLLLEGQVVGGVHMGLGMALTESFVVRDGVPVTDTLKSLGIIPAAGMPPVDAILIEEPQLEGPLGAKGVGEAGTAGAPGAVMNAINDALAPLGARVTAQPCTPERVLKALGRV